MNSKKVSIEGPILGSFETIHVENEVTFLLIAFLHK
jgi:hypothetical protein